MRTRTLQRMRNEMFSKVVDMHVGFFSDQRKGRHHFENHLRRRRGAVLHHQHPAGGFPRAVPHHRLYGDDGRHIVGAGSLLGAVSARGGPSSSAASSNACATRPARASSAWASWYRRSTKVPFGHQGHQELQRRGLYQAEVLRPERRSGPADPSRWRAASSWLRR